MQSLEGVRLLSRRDWVYSLGLLVPLFVYDLALKTLNVASESGDPGLDTALESMRSDIFFNLGYASAISYTVAIIVLVVSLLQMRMSRDV